MPTETIPLLLDHYPLRYDVTEVHAVVIDADTDTVWQALRHADLSRSPAIRALLALRGLPVRLRRALLGRLPASASARPPLTVDAMTHAGWLLLAEQPGTEIVLGQISQPWKLADPTGCLPANGPEEFAAFARPGYAKIAFNLRLQPYGQGRTLLTTETRTATTDPRSARRFGRYWRVIGPVSALIRRLMLRLVRAETEARRKPGQDAGQHLRHQD